VCACCRIGAAPIALTSFAFRAWYGISVASNAGPAQVGTPGVNASDSPYPWRGLLCLNGMSGYHEMPVLVVGETPKQYRIEAIERMRLAGRMRWLNPGERAPVPRYAIKRDT